MANGVWHVELGIEIDLTLEDLGHPEMPDLWEVLCRDRRPVGQRGLQCLECREERPHCPEWMFLRIRRGQREAVHFNSSVGKHPAKSESDEHKALKERIATTGDREGFRVVTEDRANDGARRTDVTVIGDVAVGWEIQVSNISEPAVRQRAALARRDGLVPSWTTSAKKLSEVLRGAPWSLIVPRPWQEIRAGHEIRVAGGVRILEMLHCSRVPGPCPVKRTGKCSNFHGIWEVYNPTLDDLVRGSAAGDWVPVIVPQSRWMNRFWTRPADRDLYAASVGGLPTEDDLMQGNKRRAVPSSISEQEMERICRYGQKSDHRSPQREVFDRGQRLDASAVTIPTQRTYQPQKPVGAAPALLDWSAKSHWLPQPQPCQYCGKPASLVDDHGRPSHKVCKEKAAG
ncbi:competence protein CoiA family protein [Streptomyces marianii]|uniref:competence protein CoiA family protein n=1 Tax=Streptomyces marianii TaxID=1817406 RepID=UPI001F45B1B7|nr:hypothetical protein [Streptomyces marianii]